MDTQTIDSRIKARTARIVVIGLGHAGLPVAVELAINGFTVNGVDTDPARVVEIMGGHSPVATVSSSSVARAVRTGRLSVSQSLDGHEENDCFIICVPTSLTAPNTPDHRQVEQAARLIAAKLRSDTLIVVQSTCAIGTTRRVLVPILERISGLSAGVDFYVAFSPERIDSGNELFQLANTPRLVAGLNERSTCAAMQLLSAFAAELVPVSSVEVAEAAKLFENAFRFINVSFVNYLAILCDACGLSVWEVIDAAATKPFAFLPHVPGPGVGGECIPTTSFFLAAESERLGIDSGLIEAAGRLNDAMPRFVVDKLRRLLARSGMSLETAQVLLIGMAYKANSGDVRNSASIKVFELLRRAHVEVSYFDPYVPSVTIDGDVARSLDEATFREARPDCIVVLTRHDGIDLAHAREQARLVLDTRGPSNDAAGSSIYYL